MKRSDLKKVLKPIIEECLKDALLEGGILSSIISECVKGLQIKTSSIVVEEKTNKRKEPTPEQKQNFSNRLNELKSDLNETKSLLGKAAGLPSSMFENVSPIENSENENFQKTEDGKLNEEAIISSRPALRGIPSNDPGINIDGFMEIVGGKNKWSEYYKMMKQKEKER